MEMPVSLIEWVSLVGVDFWRGNWWRGKKGSRGGGRLTAIRIWRWLGGPTACAEVDGRTGGRESGRRRRWGLWGCLPRLGWMQSPLEYTAASTTLWYRDSSGIHMAYMFKTCAMKMCLKTTFLPLWVIEGSHSCFPSPPKQARTVRCWQRRSSTAHCP